VDWIKERMKERTTWDGLVLIAAGLAMIIVPVGLIGIGCIAYGAWTIWKAE
jgi:hypothetical protein